MNIQKNSIGFQFIGTVQTSTGSGIDLSGASSLQLIFRKPDGTRVSKDASLYTDGTDGKIYYVAESGFLDAAGVWRLQGFYVDGLSEYPTTIEKFRVFDNL